MTDSTTNTAPTPAPTPALTPAPTPESNEVSDVELEASLSETLITEGIATETLAANLLFENDLGDKARATRDESVNETLDTVSQYIDGDGYIESISINQDGDIVVNGSLESGEEFDIKFTSGTTVDGEPEVTITGTVEVPSNSAGNIFEPVTVIGAESVNELVYDLNNLFDAAPIFNSSNTDELFNVEFDATTGAFSRIYSGNDDLDSILYDIDFFVENLPEGSEFEASYDDSGNILLTAVLANGSRYEFSVKFYTDENTGERVLTAEGARIRSDGTVLQTFDKAEVKGDTEILYAVSHINDRFTAADLTSGDDPASFFVAPNFNDGGFYDISGNDALSDARVTLDEEGVPENAQEGDVVGQIEVRLGNDWVPVSELPPTAQDRISVTLEFDSDPENGVPYEVNDLGEIIVADPGLIESTGSAKVTIDAKINSRLLSTTSTTVGVDFDVVDAVTTFVPTRSSEGEFELGEITYGIPEGVEIESQEHFEGADAAAFGTDSVDVITYSDKDGNTVSAVIDSDPTSDHYGVVLTTIIYKDSDPADSGLFIYDANGALSEEYTLEELDVAETSAGFGGDGRRLSGDGGEEKLQELRDTVPGGHVFNNFADHNEVLAYVEYLDPDTSQRRVNYSYVDVNTGEWVTKSAEYDSAEANNFFESYNAYESATRDGGLVAFQTFVGLIGVAALGPAAGGAGLVGRNVTGLAPIAVGGQAAQGGGESSFFGRKAFEAQASISNFGTEPADTDAIPWETVPHATESDFRYDESEGIPVDGERDTDEEAAAKTEIIEAEEATQYAEDKFATADNAVREADAAKDLADEAELLAEADPRISNKVAAIEARNEAKEKRRDANEALEEANEAASYALIEVDEAVVAAEAFGDPELIALASGQSETIGLLFAFFAALGNESDARGFVSVLSHEAAEIYPNGNVPTELQDEIDAAEADLAGAGQLTSVARTNYLQKRSDFSGEYAEFTQAEAANATAIAKYDSYLQHSAELVYIGGDLGDRETGIAKSAYLSATDDARETSSAAKRWIARAEEAETEETTSVNELATWLDTVDTEISDAWAFDPQAPTNGTRAIPANIDIEEQKLFAGPEAEGFFGTSLVQSSSYVDPDNSDQYITTFVDVDPNSETYGQVALTTVATSDTSLNVYNAEGEEIAVLTYEVDGTSLEDTDGRRLIDVSQKEEDDASEFASAIPSGARTQRHQYHDQFSYQQYTTTNADGTTTSWIRIRYLDANNNTQYRTVNVTENPDVLATATAYLSQLDSTNTGTYLGTLTASSFSTPGLITGTLLLTAHFTASDRFDSQLATRVSFITTAIAGAGFATILGAARDAINRANVTRSRARNDFLHVINQVPPPTFIPSRIGEEGTATGAGLDLNADGTVDLPLTVDNLTRTDTGELVLRFDGQNIPLPDFADGEATLIVDDNGTVGLDFAVENRFGNLDGDGLVDLAVTGNTILDVNTPDGGTPELGLRIPGLAGVTTTTPDTFIPLSDETLGSARFGFNNNVPGINIENTFLEIVTNTPNQIPAIQSDENGLFVLVRGVRILVEVLPNQITTTQVTNPDGTTTVALAAEIDGVVIALPSTTRVTLNAADDDGTRDWVLTDDTAGLIANLPEGFDEAIRVQGGALGANIDGNFLEIPFGTLVQRPADATDADWGTAQWGIDLEDDGQVDVPLTGPVYNAEGVAQGTITGDPTIVYQTGDDGTLRPSLDLTGNGVGNLNVPADAQLVLDINGNAGYVAGGAATDANGNALVNIPLQTTDSGPRIGDNGQIQVETTDGVWIDIAAVAVDAQVTITEDAEVVIDFNGTNVTLGGIPEGTIINPNNPTELILGGPDGITVPVPQDAAIVVEGGELLFDFNGDGVGQLAVPLPDAARGTVGANGTQLWLDLNGNGVANYQITTPNPEVRVEEADATTGEQQLTLVWGDEFEIPTDFNAATNLIPEYGDTTGTQFTLVPGGPVVTLPAADIPDDWTWIDETDGARAGWTWGEAAAALIVFAIGVTRGAGGVINYPPGSQPLP